MNAKLGLRKVDLTYVIGAAACVLLLYGGYHWYHTPSLTPASAPSETVNDAHRTYLRGMQFYRERNYTEAARCYENALATNPDHVQARVNLALAHIRLDNVETAFELIKKMTDSQTTYAPAYAVLGELYQRKHSNELARRAYEHALTLDSNLDEARILLAQLETREGSAQSCARAINNAQTVVAKNPRNATALITLGDAYLMNGNYADARTTYQKAYELSPDLSDMLTMIIGKTYERELNFEQACTCYRASLEKRDNAPAHVALAGALFALGDFEQGFKEYEWRWKLSNMQNLKSMWDGSDVRGKRIFILGENGLGDVLQYVRFAKTLKDRGAYVMVHTAKPLVPLFKQCDYIDEVVPVGEPHPAYDFITSMQSIPFHTHVTTKNLPNKPYVFADSQLVQEWKTKLSADKNFKIGLCWQPGDDSYLSATQKRAISLQALAPFARRPGISFYCLQKNREQIANAPFKIIDLGPSFDVDHGAFMDTAAVMKNMDLVISVDTSVAHLAGALGVPLWVLVPYSPDVRWMVNRTDSVWYPHATLFRQSKPGNWDSAVHAMIQASRAKIK